MHPADPRGGAPRRPATLLESVDEIRALARRASTLREPAPPRPEPRPPAGPSPASVRDLPPVTLTPVADPADETMPFRPSGRPGMAVLSVLDDGDDEGEVVRIRATPFVIGRVEGHLVIPHDPGISGRHVEILRRLDAGYERWLIRDLNSTNGTFVRAAGALLRDGQELLIGGRRYRFDAAPAATGPGPIVDAIPATRQWSRSAPGGPEAGPGLVELQPEGEGRRFPLPGPEAWIGRDPARCGVVLDDPMVSPRHARIVRDDRGRWSIQNQKSLNGLWVRIDEMPLDRGGQFQLGEQRFLIRVP